MRKLPQYIAETDTEQWGFVSLENLNKWIELNKVDPKDITVYSVNPISEEEWKYQDGNSTT